MRPSIKLALVAAAVAIGLGGLHATRTATPDGGTTVTIGLVPAAEAVVGRPLTPVSVAGVSRRTARRTARRN